jgi:adenylate kinase family enzyme
LAEVIGAEFVELDAIQHQPGWTQLTPDEFRARVQDATAADRWVVDGNYSAVREDIVWARADTIVWLDLPKRVVMRQIARRTAGRVFLRRQLWNGNRETLRNALSRDPDRSVVMWAWTTHSSVHDRYRAAAGDPRWSHLRFVRLSSRDDVSAFLDEVGTGVSRR